MAMLCTDAFTEYCVIVFVQANAENELALGVVQCMNKTGKPPKVVYTCGETGLRNNELFQKF